MITWFNCNRLNRRGGKGREERLEGRESSSFIGDLYLSLAGYPMGHWNCLPPTLPSGCFWIVERSIYIMPGIALQASCPFVAPAFGVDKS